MVYLLVGLYINWIIILELLNLNDDVKMGQIAITLLEGTAYNWFAV